MIGYLEIMKFVFALLVVALCSSNTPCGFFEGFGKSFGGDLCSRDTSGACINAYNIKIHIYELIDGNINALYLILQDILNLYSHVMNSEISCQWSISLKQFIENLQQLPFILLKNYQRIAKDVQCISDSLKLKDYYQVGFCIGDIIKVLTSPQ